MGATTSYGGKPSGSFTAPADGQWHRIDIDTDDPTHSGLEIQEMYIHDDLTWKCGVCGSATTDPKGHARSSHPSSMVFEGVQLWWNLYQNAAIRVKYVRENGDDTAYQDFRFGPVDGYDDFLINHNHSEKGQANQGGRWWIQVKGGLSKVVITTRYSKTGTAY